VALQAKPNKNIIVLMMQDSDTDSKLLEKLALLTEKYEKDGQDPSVHLEGLYHTNYLKYWEYIRLETLLSLQNPKTNFPDELIFITYHQITELYFKMVLHEIRQLTDIDNLDSAFFLKRMTRINWYFSNLIQSFDVISVGMENEQFMKFRSALHPASGFQSVQYRMVEIASTDFINLVSKESRDDYSDYSTIDDMYDNIYWKRGAIDTKTGKKTLTLEQFEEKYTKDLIKMAYEFKSKNLWSIFKKLPFDAQENKEIVNALKRFDTYVNINWPLAHYKYAVSYLFKSNGPVAATGGTNWQKYLPPRFQKQIFFPSLWTVEEINEWGKEWVETEVLPRLK
jgi:tryptophan 2,3-dioxygenase